MRQDEIEVDSQKNDLLGEIEKNEVVEQHKIATEKQSNFSREKVRENVAVFKVR